MSKFVQCRTKSRVAKYSLVIKEAVLLFLDIIIPWFSASLENEV